MKEQEKLIDFLPGQDALAITINKKATELFLLLQNFEAHTLAIESSLRDYFINHHLGKRLFFSIQNSAHIIYESVKKVNKKIEEINIVDYGAGLGTLYLLAGLLNFRRTVYNDYMPDWKDTAEAICNALGIQVGGYVTGDIDAVLAYGAANNFAFDIIASRNVIEHIYDLPFFYRYIHAHSPAAVIFSTTSANYHNPAMRLKHYLLHKKIEKEQYLPYRKRMLEKEWPGITPAQLAELSVLTRGKALEDFTIAIENYKNKRPVAPVPYLRTNTCLPDTGLWCEHLLTRREYESIFTTAGYKLEYSAGYWDTHYSSGLMNIITRAFNGLIALMGKRNGTLLSPFVNVVAYN